MKDQILKLRSEGKTYNQIVNKLGCSKGTVSYHCGEGQKEKHRARSKRNRNNTNEAIKRKIDFFLNKKVKNFKGGCSGRGGINRSSASYIAFYKKILGDPYCYLTGREIDFSMPSGYQLDHFIPYSKGGGNHLSNCRLSSKEANQAKRDLMFDDFIKLCVDVCKHNGYEVKRIQD